MKMNKPIEVDGSLRTVVLSRLADLGVTADWQDIQMSGDIRIDGLLTVDLDGTTHTFAVEEKRRLPALAVGAVLSQLRYIADATGRPTILVTDYVSAPTADLLRRQGQSFADAAGNVHLRSPGLLVHVSGRKPTKSLNAPAGKALTATALKIFYVMLCRPELADATQREIAAAASVALGAVPPALDALTKAGHLLVSAQARRLNPTRPTLDEWARGYAQTLRHKTLAATYETTAFDGWPEWRLPENAQWGGEPAANRLVGHLTPGMLTLYATQRPTRFLVEHRMHPAGPEGRTRLVEHRIPFWNPDAVDVTPEGTVHPVLVYADLLATVDTRCIEAADLIHAGYLARSFPAR